MNNDSDRDGNSSGDLVVEPAAPMGDRDFRFLGLGVSSPYELTTPGTHPPGRLRSEVHITVPDNQARQSTEETPQDHIEDFEGRKQRKGKGVMNEESREERIRCEHIGSIPATHTSETAETPVHLI
ncbi:hypothetical protein LWI29_001563 [Acer saccharum]|uniref:Uncharacterized protein n=1 Tax=Acer saccharum TaxID=4024 RepID=A0AA39S0I0_ACESA|nr:hypothetical protein LWI29_001563 [Acer saccharum]